MRKKNLNGKIKILGDFPNKNNLIKIIKNGTKIKRNYSYKRGFGFYS